MFKSVKGEIMKGLNVAIIGISGYTGLELLRILTQHTIFNLKYVTSRKESGKKICEIYPELYNTRYGDIKIINLDLDLIKDECHLVFLAVPHGVSMNIVPKLLESKIKVVDLSADFRLKSKEVYEGWYDLEHKSEELLKRSVYGLIEIYREKIKNADLVANPGCYPTSVILGLYPLLKEDLLYDNTVIIDSKSGTTGAGRNPKVTTLFCEVFDDFKPYNLKKHRHTPEIEQELSIIAGKEIKISFNPHLLPINRGILSSMYVRLNAPLNEERLYKLYLKYYSNEKWVRILPPNVLPRLREVRGSMFCDISIIGDTRTNITRVITAIDNLCRGASGQAVANANLMMNLEEDLGLKNLALIP